MTKKQAAALKPGDFVRLKGYYLVWEVEKVSPFVKGLYTSQELKNYGKWDGYLIYLKGLSSPVNHKKVEVYESED